MMYRGVKRFTALMLSMSLSLFLTGFTIQQNTTEQGLYFVSLEIAEKQVKVGRNNMKLFIGERNSKAPLKEKLRVEVVPWMPAHEHGTSEQPVIKYLGRGYYSIESVDLTMPGLWELYVRINKGSKDEDTAVFNVNVR
ncbi:MAG TPA: FixH family protein [Dissulfurispiraceae bacterium]